MGRGSWTFDGTTYQFEFFVTAISPVALDEPNVERWKNALSHASEILFNATHGQLRINKIHFLNPGPLSDDDIFLHGTDAVTSTTASKCKACETPSMSGYINLDPLARQGPNDIVHELGHYLACLEEEYYVFRRGGYRTIFRMCTNDETFKACFMEFGSDKGLQLDAAGNVSSVQPPSIVDQFCFGDHRAGTGEHLHSTTSGLSWGFNDQHVVYGKSCWETMKDVFDQLKLPTEQTSAATAYLDFDWNERTPTNKYAILILGSAEFADLGIETAIKNSVKSWASFSASNSYQLALLTDVAIDQPVRQMKPFNPNELTAFSRVIDEFNFASKTREQRRAAENLLDAEQLAGTGFFLGAMAAFQYLVLLAPGDYASDNDVDLAAFVSLLENARVQLVITTYGSGKFADRWEQLGKTRKSVDHQNIPRKKPESASAFDLQNDWIERFFSITPGFDGTSIFRGQLSVPPDFPAVAGEPIQSFPAPRDGRLELDFDVRSSGVDFPVLIEETAQSAVFVLSEPVGGSLKFSLLSPAGRTFDETSDGIKTSRPSDAVASYEIPGSAGIGGRWILRLQRIDGDRPLPFYLFAGSKNNVMDIQANVDVTGRKIKFECRTRYRFALDFVDVTVEVYPAAADSFHPDLAVQSLLLRRQHSRHPATGENVELSTGNYTAITELEPGAYLAMFTARNAGQAVDATNPRGSFNGAIVETDVAPIPAFSRVLKRRFIVPETT